MPLTGSPATIPLGKEECDLQFRHEVKHEISQSDLQILRGRLRALMKPDPHARDGKYEIRSLYFDDWDDTALREKLDGVSRREKYRLRFYNRDPSVVHLERKVKCGGLGFKETALLSAGQARAIASGAPCFGADGDDAQLRALLSQMQSRGLSAKVIVDYTREPFVFSAGNVRVTLDYDIRSALRCTDFLNPDCITVPVAGNPCILEVKWDSFLPDVIRDAVQLGDRHAAAYSKYAAARMYD